MAWKGEETEKNKCKNISIKYAENLESVFTFAASLGFIGAATIACRYVLTFSN